MLDGSVASALYQLAWPMLIGMLAITGFNLVDTFFVAQLGTLPLAAMTYTFPIIMILNGLTLGLGAGLTPIVSQRFGAGDMGEVRKLSRDGLLLALLIVILIMTIGLLTMRPLFTLLGAESVVLDMTVQYMRIWYWGTPFVVIPMVGNSAIRGTGDTKTPAMIMTVAGILNTILDPFLIFGWWIFPRLELEGAAIATVIARATTMVMAIYVLVIRDKQVEIKIPSLSTLWKHWMQVLLVGGPAALTNILGPVTFGFLTRIVSLYGTIAVAAFGAGARVEMFVLMVPAALGSALMVFVGQNWGARQKDRVSVSINLSVKFMFFSGLLIVLAISLTAQHIATFFSDQNDMIHELTKVLRISFPGIIGDTIFMIAISSFNAVRRPAQVLKLYGIRILLLIIPLTLIGSWLFDLTGLWTGIGFSRLLCFIIALTALKNLTQKNDQQESNKN